MADHTFDPRQDYDLDLTLCSLQEQITRLNRLVQAQQEELALLRRLRAEQTARLAILGNLQLANDLIAETMGTAGEILDEMEGGK
jgi:hypothetical protein